MLNCRIVHIGRPQMHNIARSDLVEQFFGVSRSERIGHAIQVIEVSKKLVKTVDGREKLIQITMWFLPN
jgi:hypothetical protein